MRAVFIPEMKCGYDGIAIERQPYPHVAVGDVKGFSTRIPLERTLSRRLETREPLCDPDLLDEAWLQEIVGRKGRKQLHLTVQGSSNHGKRKQILILLRASPSYSFSLRDSKAVWMVAEGRRKSVCAVVREYLFVLSAGGYFTVRAAGSLPSQVATLEFERSGDRMRWL